MTSGIGRLWVVGGYGRSGFVLPEVEHYIPERGSWEPLRAPLPTPRVGCACIFHGSKLYVMGGMAGSSGRPGGPGGAIEQGLGAFSRVTSLVEAYDVSKEADDGGGKWERCNPMIVARDGCSAVALGDHQILVVGGAAASAEMFDPISDTWTRIQDMNIPRAFCTAIMSHEGVYVLGGRYTGDHEKGDQVAGDGSTRVELYQCGAWRMARGGFLRRKIAPGAIPAV